MNPDEQEHQLLASLPENGDPIGNTTLMRQLQWTEDAYWSVRNRVLDRGLLELGRGKGGSVRRILEPAPSALPSVAVPAAKSDFGIEALLYAPMTKVIGDSWAADAGFDSKIVQLTAQQGSRTTGGKWSRPDIAIATVSTYPYLPGRHFDVITFEVKTADGIDITCVYEALAYLRSATRSYVLLHVPSDRSSQLDDLLVDVYAEAKKHGIGVITADRPDDYDTWEEVVNPVRVDPDPRRLNDFLAKQFTKEQLEQIMKWFK